MNLTAIPRLIGYAATILFSLLLLPTPNASAFSTEYKEAYEAALEWEGFKANDAGMNAAYKKLLETLPKQQAAALRVEEREWMNNCDNRAKWDVKNDRVPERYLVAATASRRKDLEALLKKANASSRPSR
jgi:hypothetical protein